jgi:methionyl-tRNA formyltransferase
MQMEATLDTGPLLHTIGYPIQPTDTAATLHNSLAKLGAKALLQCLLPFAEGTITTISQDESQACYASKIHKEESSIDWSQPATLLERQIRAFNPWPVAQTQIQDQILRVWSAAALVQDTTAPSGTVLSANKTGIDVATGYGILRLLKVQPAGKRIMTAQDYLNAHSLVPGTVLLNTSGKAKD